MGCEGNSGYKLDSEINVHVIKLSEINSTLRSTTLVHLDNERIKQWICCEWNICKAQSEPSEIHSTLNAIIINQSG